MTGNSDGDLYLTVTLELTFQPLAAGLSVPQSLGQHPELGREGPLLLCRLQQLGNTLVSLHPERGG